MNKNITIAAARNTEPPAYKLIKDIGFKIEKKGDSLIAKKDNLTFYASGALELAGLIFLYESKGENWKVADEIIDEYCDLFKDD